MLRALRIQEQSVGMQHPNAATYLHTLASLYFAQDNYEQAEPHLQRALAIREQVLGASHSATLTVLADYVALLRTVGREAEATTLEQRTTVHRTNDM